MKKVLFVPGIYNFEFYQHYWKKECAKRGYGFLEFDDMFYGYWDFDKMKKMIKQGREVIRKNPGLIVVCHSFGGILINCILSGMDNYDVSKLVIIESPLSLEGMGMRRRKDMLGYERNFRYDCEVFSFGGYLDLIVLFWFTRYVFGRHCNILSDHMGILLLPLVVRKILNMSGIYNQNGR